jgi:hypothetical protein
LAERHMESKRSPNFLESHQLCGSSPTAKVRRDRQPSRRLTQEKQPKAMIQRIYIRFSSP